MFTEDIAKKILFQPLHDGADELYLAAAYATHTMLSWFLTNLELHQHQTLRVAMIIGMVPYNHLSVTVHDGFCTLVKPPYPPQIDKVECSYLYDSPAFHGNLYIWKKHGVFYKAFMGSAPFVQSAFTRSDVQESMVECDAQEAWTLYSTLIGRSVYCNHAEIEEYVQLVPSHPVLDMELNLVSKLDNYESVTLSLVTKNGKPGSRSGLNWGQRPRRDPNQAYIPLPRPIAQSGFFPPKNIHFTAITDDRKQLTLRVEQQNDKAIATPERNSDLGEYFRNRLGLANGAFVTRNDLDAYGRTDVTFYKLDDETYYMDFSI
jgi:hypothetical protein